MVNSQSQKFYYKKTPTGWDKKRKITVSTNYILREAEIMGVTWKVIKGTEVIELTYKNKKSYFVYQTPPSTTLVGQHITSNKQRTRQFLSKNGISVTKGFLIHKNDDQDHLEKIFHDMKKPLVLKPSDGKHGDGVYLDINEKKEYLSLTNKLMEKYEELSVEEMFQGTEYRVLATNKKVIGITQRIPANVTGDGRSTIKELIDEKNKDPRRSDSYETALLKIKIDDQVIDYLAHKGLTVSSIPKNNQQVFLRQNSNLSTGGDSIDVTDQAHPSVKEIATKAIKSVPGIEFGGIDLMTTDISQEQTQDSYIIIEINGSPMLAMHDSPFVGKNRHAAREFLFLVFPDLNTQYQ